MWFIKQPNFQWIGLRENLQETRVIFPLNMGFSCKFSLKPIHWNFSQHWSGLVGLHMFIHLLVRDSETPGRLAKCCATTSPSYGTPRPGGTVVNTKITGIVNGCPLSSFQSMIFVLVYIYMCIKAYLIHPHIFLNPSNLQGDDVFRMQELWNPNTSAR